MGGYLLIWAFGGVDVSHGGHRREGVSNVTGGLDGSLPTDLGVWWRLCAICTGTKSWMRSGFEAETDL